MKSKNISETKLLCIIGNPLTHSLSPIMHNTVFKVMKINAKYLAFEVKEQELEETVNRLIAEHFIGFNVTIPYKEKIINYIDNLDNTAQMVGAVNTVKVAKDRLIGYNTDVFGVIKTFEIQKIDIADRKVLLFGAGGAAKSVIVAFNRLGVNQILIVNRSQSRAINLIRQMEKKVKLKLEFVKETNLNEIAGEADIIVNATPVGMYPQEQDMIIQKQLIKKKHVVFDLVYNPIKTNLLKVAEKRGAIALSGIDMLVYQGAEALKIWLDIDPPIDIMKKVVIEELCKK